MQRPSPRFRSEGYFVYEIFEKTFYQNLYGDAMVVLISETMQQKHLLPSFATKALVYSSKNS